MDRESQIARRRSIITIAVLGAVFVLATIGLIIIGVRSGKIASEKVLRSEFAKMINNRETMNCTVTWAPVGDEDATITPTKLTLTFAMDKGGENFYVDRYDLYGAYASIYARGDNVYIWSAVPQLAEKEQLFEGDYVARRVGDVQLTRKQFDEALPDFFDEMKESIKNVGPGAEIQCGPGGTSSYSEPKDIKDWKKADEE